jgi:MinD superfamily P-loop ATPase
MELSIISGKGGTGKSSISAAFATLATQVVLADCDVDAGNQHIQFLPEHDEEQAFTGGQKALINRDFCTNCGICIPYCRFDAISFSDNEVVISETLCDGCHLCNRVCPHQAITMLDYNKSRMYTGSFRKGRMVYGQLAPGEENSGKLVNLVREKAKQQARLHHIDTIIIDGPPGIGCPVISSITGTDHVIIVTEPSLSALLDLARATEVAQSFGIKTSVIINKYDLDETLTNEIETWCKENQLEIIGRVPFDPMIVEAMVNCKSIIEWAPGSAAGKSIREVFNTLLNGKQ